MQTMSVRQLLDEMRLYYGALINNVLGDRKLGQAPFIVGTSTIVRLLMAILKRARHGR